MAVQPPHVAPPHATPRDDGGSCRVAVIGAGIGGASLSFYLQQFGANASLPRCEITAFERNDYIGGRLKHVTGFEAWEWRGGVSGGVQVAWWGVSVT